MIGVIVAAHAKLAEALVETIELVVRHPTQIVSVAIAPGDNTESFRHRLEEAVNSFEETDGVLILTDMFGGTPSNVGMTLHSPGKVEVITGTNLPMLIKAVQICATESNVEVAALTIKQAGQAAIAIASEVLAISSIPHKHPQTEIPCE